jgi:nucleoid-associated protein YgaU
MSDYGIFSDHERHTAIRVQGDDKWTRFIPMHSSILEVQKMETSKFARQYKPLVGYPLKRAAAKYLHRAELQNVTSQAREHLKRILDTEEDETPCFTQPQEEEIMATKKDAAPAAAKKAAPAPVAKKATPVTPAPAKKAAKAVEAAPKAAGRGRPRDDNAVYKIGNTESVKRGFLAEFVAAGTKLGEFTRDKLVAKFEDASRATRYFYYCTGKGIFDAV